MRMWGNRSQRLASLLALGALVLVLPACGGGGGGGGGSTPGAPTAGFTINDPAPAANFVRFSAANCVNDICTLDVAIGGPTTSSDYYAFAFDILCPECDPGLTNGPIAQFVAGSDTVGPFLTGTVDSVASQSGARVVVGVSKQGSVAGNGTGAAEAMVVQLGFRMLRTGTANLTFTGSPSNPNLPNCGATSPEALDSNGDCITSTNFGTGGVLTGS